MAAAVATGPDHVLCLTDGGTSDHGAPSKKSPEHGHAACCTAAVAAPAPALPASAPSAAPWPARRSIALPRRFETAASPRTPPNTRPGARAPPVA